MASASAILARRLRHALLSHCELYQANPACEPQLRIRAAALVSVLQSLADVLQPRWRSTNVRNMLSRRSSVASGYILVDGTYHVDVVMACLRDGQPIDPTLDLDWNTLCSNIKLELNRRASRSAELVASSSPHSLPSPASASVASPSASPSATTSPFAIPDNLQVAVAHPANAQQVLSLRTLSKEQLHENCLRLLQQNTALKQQVKLARQSIKRTEDKVNKLTRIRVGSCRFVAVRVDSHRAVSCVSSLLSCHASCMSGIAVDPTHMTTRKKTRHERRPDANRSDPQPPDTTSKHGGP